MLDFLRFAPSKSFENVEIEWLFFIHPVMFTCVQDSLFPPRVVQLNMFYFVPLYLNEFVDIWEHRCVYCHIDIEVGGSPCVGSSYFSPFLRSAKSAVADSLHIFPTISQHLDSGANNSPTASNCFVCSLKGIILHYGRVYFSSAEPPPHFLVLYCYTVHYGVIISKRRSYDFYSGFHLSSFWGHIQEI